MTITFPDSTSVISHSSPVEFSHLSSADGATLSAGDWTTVWRVAGVEDQSIGLTPVGSDTDGVRGQLWSQMKTHVHPVQICMSCTRSRWVIRRAPTRGTQHNRCAFIARNNNTVSRFFHKPSNIQRNEHRILFASRSRSHVDNIHGSDMAVSAVLHCVQKKTPTHIFFHISMNYLWI